MEYKLSIIIPTRNRQKYAANVVNNLIRHAPNSQIIVNDNSDDDSLSNMLTCIDSKNLLYSYFPENMSVIENFENALFKADGEYVTIIGDDDYVGPNIEEIIDQAIKQDIDSISLKKNKAIHYFWPDCVSKNWRNIGGKFFFSDFTSNAKKLSIDSEISLVQSRLGSGPLGLPRIYMGIVSMKLIRKIVKKHGSIFGGISPDVYSSFLIAMECQNPIVYDFPFIIPGACPESTSAARANKSDIGSGTVSINHLSRFKNINWDPRVPEVYTPITVWALTTIQALKLYGITPKLSSYSYLYASCLAWYFNNTYKGVLASFITYNLLQKAIILALIIIYLPFIYINYFISKIPLLLRPRPGAAKFFCQNLESVVEAYEVLEQKYKDHEINLDYRKHNNN